jgi:hypothetical protein
MKREESAGEVHNAIHNVYCSPNITTLDLWLSQRWQLGYNGLHAVASQKKEVLKY